MFVGIIIASNKTNTTVNTNDGQDTVEESAFITNWKQKSKEMSDEIVERLKQSSNYDDIEFKEQSKDTTGDRVAMLTTYYTNDSELRIKYDYEMELLGIELYHSSVIPSSNKFNEGRYRNQILTITYLKEYDITENDFSNKNAMHDYTEFLKVLAGISEYNGVFTDVNKKLYISCWYNSTSWRFSISSY